MAVPYIDTGQAYTYLALIIFPFIIGRIVQLLRLFKPRDQAETDLLFALFSRELAAPRWPFRGRHPRVKFRKVKHKPVHAWNAGDDGNKPKAKTYLWALAWIIFKVGCCVEYVIRLCLKRWCRLLHLTKHQSIRLAFLADKGRGDPHVRFDSDSIPVGVDNHASRCLAQDKRLFENLTPFCSGRVGGIDGGLQIKGQGTLVLNINDDNGRPHRIKIPNSLYLPELKTCLLSPQHWAQEARDDYPLPNGTRMENNARSCTLIWGQGQFRKTIPFNASTNTPIFYTSPRTSAYRAFVSTFMALEAPHFRREHVLQAPGLRVLDGPPLPEEEFVAEENVNYAPSSVREGAVPASDGTVRTSNRTRDLPLAPEHPGVLRRSALTFDPSPPLEEHEEYSLSAPDDEAELMRWHYRLGHLSFKKLRLLALNGEIPKKLAKIRPLRCAGCLFGAMTKVAWRGKEQKAQHSVFTATKPGECVSVDHLQSTEPGFFGQAKGRLTKTRYKNATVFVDHFSRLQYIHLMTTNLTSSETLEAKHAFERFAAEHGVKITHYHCDNGRFADTAFIRSCEESRQKITFCGVNAHFQNGIAERAIRDLSESARKQLLHAKQRWPQAVSTALWPYALRSAAYLNNVLPTLEGGQSKLELFSGIRVGSNMKVLHTLFCPVFALQNALAAGHSIPRWNPRARIGLNLGPSPTHARNVHLVLSLTTGLVSPQFHCRFDDFFETCKHGASDASMQSTWQRLAGLTRASINPMLMTDERLLGGQRLNESRLTQEPYIPPSDISQTNSEVQDTSEFFEDSEIERSVDIAEPPYEIASPPSQEPHQNQAPEVSEVPAEVPAQAGTSSRGRARRMTRAMAESVSQQQFYGRSNMHYMASSAMVTGQTDEDHEHDEHLALQDRMRHPIAFHAEMMGDIMYLQQALRQPDASQFVDAVIQEVNGHVDNKHWTLIKRSEVPKDADVVPSVWSMRRKRDITTNEIKKYKARLNLHGGKQVFGMNYYETYAPVVTWFAIRLLIVIGIIFGWALRQVDFVMAYPQAPIECDMYMELPQGIRTSEGESKDHVLKLLKNIYGQKQAGRVWNEYLVDKLNSIGFKPSLIDDCVFYRDDIIFMVYVDDGIFLGKDDGQLKAVIREIQGTGLNIEDQGHPADYVGVNIKKLRDGSYEFTQRALIDAIIADVKLTDAKVKPVPAKVSLQLHAFKDAPPFNLDFNYRSVVGKLNYLTQTTRPDIMYATHQLAKYSSDPREPHGEAMLYLVRYLKKTRDIGIRFKPNTEKGFECYCDADFSGNWNKSFADVDPSTAKSRSGWAVFYAGCLIIWASKLQSQVALSTTEAEYIAMSMALRDVIPIMGLIKEMKQRNIPVICTKPYVYCKVFEDNSGALELARLPKLRPRTKHINVCYHHFREHVRDGSIKIFPVGTADQIADVLTKALAQNDFTRHRMHLCGI